MARIVKHFLGQEATRLLRQMLLNGRFVVGQRLVEDRIASELGISRTPLREALHRLAQEGLLEKRRAGGYSLRPLEPVEVEDAINIRSMLESHAAALASDRATPEQTAALERNLEEFRTAHTAGDIPRLVALNSEFHATMRAAAHSPLLAQMLMELDGVVERMLRSVISCEEASWSDADHQRIFEGIKRHSPLDAAEAMRDHVRHGKEKILAQMREAPYCTRFDKKD